MAGHINMIEFATVEGYMLLQKVEDISSITETVIPGRNSTPRKVMHILLSNNNRVQVVGETRESIITKIRNCSGAVVSIFERAPDPTPEPADA